MQSRQSALLVLEDDLKGPALGKAQAKAVVLYIGIWLRQLQQTVDYPALWCAIEELGTVQEEVRVLLLQLSTGMSSGASLWRMAQVSVSMIQRTPAMLGMVSTHQTEERYPLQVRTPVS